MNLNDPRVAAMVRGRRVPQDNNNNLGRQMNGGQIPREHEDWQT